MGNMFDAMRRAEEERERRRREEEEERRRSTAGGAGSGTPQDDDGPPEPVREPERRPRAARREVPRGVDERVVAARRPEGAGAERFRAVRNNLLSVLTPPWSLALASSEEGEDSAVVAANLAVVLGEADRGRVLLVDADFRTRGVEALLGVSGPPGLAEVLETGMNPSEAVRATAMTGLDVLPRGRDVSNPGALLYHARIDELMKRLHGTWSIVLVNLPPVIAWADAGIVGRALTGAVLVVGMEGVERKTAEKAIESLDNAGVRVVGTVATNSRRAARL